MKKIQNLYNWKIEKVDKNKICISTYNKTLIPRIINITEDKYKKFHVNLEKCYINNEYVYVVTFFKTNKINTKTCYFKHEELLKKINELLNIKVIY